ncbi:MAG: hypothetical protein ACRCXD_16165 [Luteolibacter sp.]
MQRWIVFGVVVVLMAVAGGGFALRIYKQNRPQPIWVPLPINADLPLEKRNELAAEIKKRLLKPDILIQVSKDLSLAKIMELPTDEAAANEVAQRLFVEVGEAAAPTGGTVPSINIGIKGKSKDTEVSGKIAMRLMQDVLKILGIKTPPAK